MSKHTKGDWHAHDGQIYPEETGKTLALIPYWDKEDKEKEANAMLIAAAPDMLKALQSIDDYYLGLMSRTVGEVPSGLQDEVRGAISKAIH